jgi:hypothetical protein
MGTNTLDRRFFSIVASAIVIGCVHVNAGRVPELPTTPAQGPDGIAAGQSETTARVLLDEDVVADFRRRVQKYMKLHAKIQKQGTRQTSAMDIGENLVSRQALAMRLRFARHDARPGDLFTPSIAMMLRKAIGPPLRGFTAEWIREAGGEDVPETFVLVVNGDYPVAAPRSTMPVTLLEILPPLPKDLQYRVVGTHLLLIDLDANIIVDFMLDVICPTC